jgi:hypothetical protein
VIKITQSGNGHNQEPNIGKTYEHLDEGSETQTTQDRWVKRSEEDTEIVFGDEVREDLGIEEEDGES